MTYVYADPFWQEQELEMVNVPFNGDGEILAFDVNEQGEILICVREHATDNNYFMIFNIQGELRWACRISSRLSTHGKFGENGTIILFLKKSAYAWIIDETGKLIEQYQDNVGESRKPLEQDKYLFEDYEFRRNAWHSQIILISNGEEKIFYEVSTGRFPSSILFTISFLTIILGFSILIIELKKYQEGKASLYDLNAMFRN